MAFYGIFGSQASGGAGTGVSAHSFNNVKLTFTTDQLSYSGSTVVETKVVNLLPSTLSFTGQAAGWYYILCSDAGIISLVAVPVGEIVANTTIYTPTPTYNTTKNGYYYSLDTTKRIVGIVFFDATIITEVIEYGNGTNKNDDWWESVGFSNPAVASANNEMLQFTGTFDRARGANVTLTDLGAGTDPTADGLRITANNNGLITISGQIDFNLSSNATYFVYLCKNGVIYKNIQFAAVTTTNGYGNYFAVTIPANKGDYFGFRLTISVGTASVRLTDPCVTFKEY